jgi:hypothetical protein
LKPYRHRRARPERRVAHRVAIQAQQGVDLESGPQGEPFHPVARQLARQPGGRGALSEAAYVLGRASLRPLENGPGPGVEAPPAARAAIVVDRVTLAAVNLEALVRAASGASQPIGWSQATSLA